MHTIADSILLITPSGIGNKQTNATIDNDAIMECATFMNILSGDILITTYNKARFIAISVSLTSDLERHNVSKPYCVAMMTVGTRNAKCRNCDNTESLGFPFALYTSLQ